MVKSSPRMAATTQTRKQRVSEKDIGCVYVRLQDLTRNPGGVPMGPTYIRAKIQRPDGKGRTLTTRFLVDPSAVYTVLPKPLWTALKLKPQRTLEFSLADGTT